MSHLEDRFVKRVPAVLLIAMILAIYWRVGGYPFVLFDDDRHIVGNPHVRAGLTLEGARWAFSANTDAGFIPLTWLSRMLDVSLFGMNAGGHHLVNVLFHLLNTLLLFGFLRSASGSVWRSGIAAALFAVHPLHVESVAWVTERKDVLCAFFFLLSLRAYVRYAERPGAPRYAAVALFFVLSLLSKPMAVTLPFVLLLLDGWPLGRAARMREAGAGRWGVLRTLLAEKAPLFGLALLGCAATLAVHEGSDTIVSVTYFPAGARVANALVSYVAYLGKTVWPSGLAVFYPHPATVGSAVPPWKAAGALVLLAAASAAVLFQRRRRPYLAAGWLWYLGMLFPVIGVVQAGDQAMADRYTYLPLIGIFVAAVWGCADAAAGSRARRAVLGTAAAAAVLALAAGASLQLTLWRDDVSLFSHAIEVAPRNFTMHNNLAASLEKGGRHEEAIVHFREALRIRPDYAEARNNLGAVLAARGDEAEAVVQYRAALGINPDYPMALKGLGLLLVRLGRAEEGASLLGRALEREPGYSDARFVLATALARQGKTDAAILHFRELLRRKPDSAEIHVNLGNVLLLRGNPDEALLHYEEALRLSPGDAAARRNMEIARERKRPGP